MLEERHVLAVELVLQRARRHGDALWAVNRLHELVEVAQRLHAREVLIRHADGELFLKVADEFHDRDGVETKVGDDRCLARGFRTSFR